MLDYEYEQPQYYEWIAHVADYVKKTFGAEVDMMAEEDAFIYEAKRGRVQVKGTTPPRDKLYILLHEVGHLVRLHENATDNTFFMDRIREVPTSERDKVMTLMEEVLAWHKADELAQRLGVPIEKRAWQRLVNKSIDKYTNWACDKEI